MKPSVVDDLGEDFSWIFGRDDSAKAGEISSTCTSTCRSAGTVLEKKKVGVERHAIYEPYFYAVMFKAVFSFFYLKNKI